MTVGWGGGVNARDAEAQGVLILSVTKFWFELQKI